MEKIFSYAWRGKRGIDVEEPKEGEGEDDHYVDDEQGEQVKASHFNLNFIFYIIF